MNHARNKLLLLLTLIMLAYAGNSLAERADRDKPIKMEADHVTVDDPNQTSTFEGNVRMQQGTLLIEAGKILIKQDKNGYNQITATGDPAHFRQKQDNSNVYAEGFGERIEYDSQAETANIYGQARVKREGDDVRGEHIIYSTRTGVFQVFGSNAQSAEKSDQGRVTIVIQPKPRKNDATPATPQQAPKPASAPKQTQ